MTPAAVPQRKLGSEQIVLVQAVRKAALGRPDPDLDPPIAEYDDNQLGAMLLFSLRSRMRLSRWGLKLLRGLFRAVEHPIPDDKALTARHLLFLDQHAAMPYWCSDKSLILFDLLLAAKLRLAGDDLDVLIDIEN